MKIPASMYRDSTRKELAPAELAIKRDLYERIPPHRRRFIDKIGYENWDPFQKPNVPFELRTDATKRTAKELIRTFLHSLPDERTSTTAYAQGALECALGIINGDEKVLGMVDFISWYLELLKKEGHCS